MVQNYVPGSQGNNPNIMLPPTGGNAPAADPRSPGGGENIVGMLPDAITLACGQKYMAVDPSIALQNIIVGRWQIPYDAGLISTRMELLMPTTASCLAAYLRVGVSQVNALDQSGQILDAFDPFVVQVSGDPGAKVRIYDPMMMFFRRVFQNQLILASLQVKTTGVAGPSITIEYSAQIRIARLGLLTQSGV